MRVQVAPSRPWRPDATRLAMRGRAIVRLKSGEVDPAIPNHRDVLLGAALAAARIDGGSIDRAVRQFSPGARITRAFEAAGATTRPGQRHHGFDELEERLGLSRTLRIEVDPEAPIKALVSELRDLEIVEMATPHYLAQTPFSLESFGVGQEATSRNPREERDLIGATEALAMEPGDSTLIVAVIDSGVALLHEEFEGRLRPGVDTVDIPSDQVSRGLRFYGDTAGRDRVPMDEMGHGSGTAGILGARGRRTPPGLAGEARILPIRALAGAVVTGRREPTAIGGLPDIDTAVKLAVDLGAKVLNLSFGTPESALDEDDPLPHAEVVSYALARGCILVAASGNSSDWTRYTPACLPGVIAVGSVGLDAKPSTFTTRGEHVDLSAPGERIHCPAVVGYRENTGTSFAAPFVAAASALAVSRAAGYSTALSAPQVRDALVRTVKPFDSGVDAAGCGAGVLDVPNMLRALDAELATTPDQTSRHREEVIADPVAAGG